MEILEGLYAYPWTGVGNNCNTYLLKGELITLIDPGHMVNEYREHCLDRLASALAADGFRFEEIQLILLTHSHLDHSEAASFLKEKSGARLAFHQEEEKHWEVMRKFFRQAYQKNIPELVPDFYLGEGELTLGKSNPLVLKVLYTPGHSPGSLSFYWEEKKALITGDVVFAASIGRTDFPDGDEKALKESIRKLAALEAEYLLPGHMGLVTGGEKVKKNFEYVLRAYFPFP